MKSFSFNRNKTRGLTLLELLLVLGILAVFVVVAFGIYPQVRDSSRANSEVTNLTAIKANINSLYTSRGGNYTGLTNAVAIDGRVYPASMVDDTSSTSSWGADVSVIANTAVTNTPRGNFAANRSFTVTYNDVPEGICLPLITGASANFQDVQVGSSEGLSVMNASGLDVTAATTACAADGAKNLTFVSN